MSSRFLSILVGILSLLWFWFSWQWHCCWVRGACCENNAAVMAADPGTADAADRAPLAFRWGSPEAFTNDKFPEYKSTILKEMTDDNNLVITGQYYRDEVNTTSSENIGIARAATIRDLLKEDIPPERIRLNSLLMTDFSGDTSAYFSGATFRWEEMVIEKSEVIQLADRVVILFPYNSTQKVADPNVDEYLNKLTERLKSTDENVILTGHTDNVGNEEYNYQLGLDRANVIRDFLLQKGVKNAQIKVLSKGKTEPVATNETDAGKHQNRRVEVQLEKK